jgi:serine/threonine protein phosphatase PrpC
VADGMGGERGGRVAAETALHALEEAPEIRSLDTARFAVRAADDAVVRAAAELPEERRGMGCALALLSLAADRGGNVGWVAAHVGDVRVLSRSPDGVVRLETRDHTPAYARWEAGEIALDEVPDSPGSNKLQRAVGRGGEADAAWVPARPGWSYLLLSDGVTKAMRLDELGDAMGSPSSRAAVEAIMRKVGERGPDDNFTVVAVRVLEGGAAEATLPSPERAAPRNLFDPPPGATVNPPRRTSPLGWIATLLALVALGVAAFAAWTVLQGPAPGPDLRNRVDSLEAEVRALRAVLPPDTFPAVRPAEPRDTADTPRDIAPAATTEP